MHRGVDARVIYNALHRNVHCGNASGMRPDSVQLLPRKPSQPAQAIPGPTFQQITQTGDFPIVRSDHNPAADSMANAKLSATAGPETASYTLSEHGL